MDKLQEKPNISLKGHLKILGYDNGSKNPKVLLDKSNAIHPENASLLFARAISGQEHGAINQMVFGTGGATVSGDEINLNPPNTTVGNADLHDTKNQYAKGLDQTDIVVDHTGSTNYSDITFRGVMGRGEPTGQPVTDLESGENFIFSEIGLKSDNDELITHVVFAPIQKSSNRIIEVEYTLRITVGE